MTLPGRCRLRELCGVRGLYRLAALCALAVLLGAPPLASAACVDARDASCCCAKPRASRSSPPAGAPVLARATCCDPGDFDRDHQPPARLAAPVELPILLAASPSIAPPRPAHPDGVSLRAHTRARGPPPGAHDHLLAKSSLLL